MYVGGYGGLSENGLCVFRELCPVSFLVIGERGERVGLITLIRDNITFTMPDIPSTINTHNVVEL